MAFHCRGTATEAAVGYKGFRLRCDLRVRAGMHCAPPRLQSGRSRPGGTERGPSVCLPHAPESRDGHQGRRAGQAWRNSTPAIQILPLSDHSRCLFSADPLRKRFRCLANSQQSSINRSHEFHSQSVSSFLIPQCGGAKLGSGLRMKIDPHAVVRLLSGSPSALFPKQRSERALPRPLAHAAPTPRPTQRRRPPLALPSWKGLLRPLARVRHVAAVIFPQGVLQ